MAFCSNCGKQTGDNKNFCDSCGKNLSGVKSININLQQVNGALIGGWAAIILGIIGIAYQLITILNDMNKWGRFYEPPMGIIIFIVLSFIVIQTGIIILGWVYKKEAVLWVMVFIGGFVAILSLILVLKLREEKRQ